MKWNWVKNRGVYQCQNFIDNELVANVSVYTRGRKQWLWQANIFTANCFIRPLDEKGWPTAAAAMQAAEESLLSFNRRAESGEAVKPAPKSAPKRKQPALPASPQKVLEADPVTRRFAELVEKVELVEAPQSQQKESSVCRQDC